LTNSFGSSTDSGRRRMRWNKEKIDVVAPIPSAREMMATAVTEGVLRSVRIANRSLFI
jgi:hypothetical protein